MRTITATDAGRSSAALLDRAVRGETVVVTRAGRRVAVIGPATATNGARARSCSGRGVLDTPPGSVQGMQLVVSDIHAARAELLGRGVDVGDVEVYPWGSFVRFRDPDGNAWAVQQLPDAR